MDRRRVDTPNPTKPMANRANVPGSGTVLPPVPVFPPPVPVPVPVPLSSSATFSEILYAAPDGLTGVDQPL